MEELTLFRIDWFGKNNLLSKKERLPGHIAIIMDGNGRWAQKRGLPRTAGHREGARTLNRIVKYCSTIGIKYLTVYAFSTENWSRPKSEVDALMELLKEYLDKADKELEGHDVKINVLGSSERLSEDLKKKISNVVEKTANNKGLVLNVAFNYGGRDEIVNAVRKIAQDVKNGNIKIQDINESLVSKKLYTAGMPDPELVIRPSGEKRISNFLIWQSSYAELWYSNVLWPDFKEKHLMQAIKDFNKRHRRFGGI